MTARVPAGMRVALGSGPLNEAGGPSGSWRGCSCGVWVSFGLSGGGGACSVVWRVLCHGCDPVVAACWCVEVLQGGSWVSCRVDDVLRLRRWLAWENPQLPGENPVCERGSLMKKEVVGWLSWWRSGVRRRAFVPGGYLWQGPTVLQVPLPRKEVLGERRERWMRKVVRPGRLVLSFRRPRDEHRVRCLRRGREA